MPDPTNQFVNVAPAADSATAPPASFEAALARLEAIVHELEEGRVGLAESLARYEEGVRLLRQCFGLLETTERRIELLAGVDAAGNPVVEPFDDTASTERAEKGAPRSRSRSTAPKRAAAEISPPAKSPPPGGPPEADKVDVPDRLF